MFYAIDPTTGTKVKAKPGLRAVCLLCNESVISKTGDIITWHFAHRTYLDCDFWSEGETYWHLSMKEMAPLEYREVIIYRDMIEKDEDGNEVLVPRAHRADILNSRGCTIEFQHSPLNPSTIIERELFYRHMIWVFDFADMLHRFKFKRQGDHHDFTWTHPRKYIWYCKKPVFLDFGKRELFHVKRMNQVSPTTGWGNWVSKSAFQELYMC